MGDQSLGPYKIISRS